MAAKPDAIPKINISDIAANLSDTDVSEESYRNVGCDLVKAFTDVGFCFIMDHGIDKELIQSCFDVGKSFFDLPLDVKKRRLRGDPAKEVYGWLPPPNMPGIDVVPEIFESDKKPDYKEVYNLNKICDKFATDDEVPGFRSTTIEFIDKLDVLSKRILLSLGYGLDLEDPKGFFDSEAKLGTRENDSTFRYAFYPAIPPEKIQEGQLRCSTHTDFGHITFLVINDVPGLKIKARNGEYIMVPYCEDGIILNVADSLEHMSGGVLHSAPHHVVITEETAKYDRYSLLYFNGPDNEAYLNPLCGDKERYEKNLTFVQHYLKRLDEIFGKS